MSDLYIGLMSGTSLDGVDGVLVDFAPAHMQVLTHQHLAFAPELRAQLMALNLSGPNELHRSALAANALTRVYADVVDRLLDQSPYKAAQVRAIGAHGQTVRHQPGLHDGTGYSLQIQNPSLLAELSGIAVVADWRNRDVAAGGQGAPLVPAFHQALFGQPGQDLAIVNIGGIANLSILSRDGEILGFDCGPGNVLMDLWCHRHTGQAFDNSGRWAASGQVQQRLLDICLQDPFFHSPPPKSTGRDRFHAEWLDRQLSNQKKLMPQDVQASLCALTAHGIANAVSRYAPNSKKLMVCGGGVFNECLMAMLQQQLPNLPVSSTSEAGLPPCQVEAAAFAWLARQTCLGLPGNAPKATGAKGARVLGGIYPA
ncbi:MAG: anhydro-N-acetylmuramic acid kinase [Betaproteobacteria bacterium]|nr:anhydro-N-acetylmuramic acid kinase [Betaproteobacteria bacterium]NBY04497.1 anhydro-N-acetylmuramic acid kinase [Betaproteobacteria bacterium]